MTNVSLPQVGCTEICPIAPYIEESLRHEIDKANEVFRAAESEDELHRQAHHESDGDYVDLGDLERARSNKEFKEAAVSAQAMEYQEKAAGCSGSHCKLGVYICQRVVTEDLNPGQ